MAGLVCSAPELQVVQVKCRMVRLNETAATFAGLVVHLRGALELVVHDGELWFGFVLPYPLFVVV